MLVDEKPVHAAELLEKEAMKFLNHLGAHRRGRRLAGKSLLGMMVGLGAQVDEASMLKGGK